MVTLGRFELPTCGLGNPIECPLHWSAGASTMLLSHLF
jgi:hypothetical protein